MEQNKPAFQLNLLLSVITLILLSLVFFAYSWAGKQLEESYRQQYPTCWPMNCANPPMI
ncbi:hypothetical protein ACF2JD_02750 [Aeromonas sp. A-5]|uniref:hypothetical protein n=1 Tax=Aeromonas ichthyocola TaxID=3367746 RepID=UPI0038EF6E26